MSYVAVFRAPGIFLSKSAATELPICEFPLCERSLRSEFEIIQDTKPMENTTTAALRGQHHPHGPKPNVDNIRVERTHLLRLRRPPRTSSKLSSHRRSAPPRSNRRPLPPRRAVRARAPRSRQRLRRSLGPRQLRRSRADHAAPNDGLARQQAVLRSPAGPQCTRAVTHAGVREALAVEEGRDWDS